MSIYQGAYERSQDHITGLPSAAIDFAPSPLVFFEEQQSVHGGFCLQCMANSLANSIRTFVLKALCLFFCDGHHHLDGNR